MLYWMHLWYLWSKDMSFYISIISDRILDHGCKISCFIILYKIIFVVPPCFQSNSVPNPFNYYPKYWFGQLQLSVWGNSYLLTFGFFHNAIQFSHIPAQLYISFNISISFSMYMYHHDYQPGKWNWHTKFKF